MTFWASKSLGSFSRTTMTRHTAYLKSSVRLHSMWVSILGSHLTVLASAMCLSLHWNWGCIFTRGHSHPLQLPSLELFLMTSSVLQISWCQTSTMWKTLTYYQVELSVCEAALVSFRLQHLCTDTEKIFSRSFHLNDTCLLLIRTCSSSPAAQHWFCFLRISI